MARYKHIDTSPRFLAVDLQRQLLPGIRAAGRRQRITDALMELLAIPLSTIKQCKWLVMPALM